MCCSSPFVRSTSKRLSPSPVAMTTDTSSSSSRRREVNCSWQTSNRSKMSRRWHFAFNLIAFFYLEARHKCRPSSSDFKIVQKKPTFYPRWNTCFDCHLYEGRLIQIIVKNSTSNSNSKQQRRTNKYEQIGEASFTAESLATKARDRLIYYDWVRATGNTAEVLLECRNFLSSAFWLFRIPPGA